MTNVHEVNASARAGFIDPFDSRPLLAYYEEIFRWHGFIRFVGLPFFREEGNVPIGALFVEPNLTRQYLSADNDSIEDASRLSQELIANEKLVILGDPGAGKSTLVSWIAWQLTSPSARELAPLSGYVPVPVVLRELDLGSVMDTASLLSVIVEHPSLTRLKEGRLLVSLLERGQIYFLLDGLDEIPKLQRRPVVDAVRSALREHARCRWLITSRVVGYDEHAVDRRTPDVREGAVDRKAAEIMRLPESADLKIERRYVAPLADDQIEAFAQRWFQRREAGPETAHEFISAIKADPQTRQLARLPNLLTLMAVVYRVQLRLPHGRALLYDKITEAYLETMDASKRLPAGDLSLVEKKRILAHVAFQMQRSRGDGTEQKREILISGRRLRELVRRFLSVEKAEAFIEHLGARSGIIQQRGPDQYAFAHLSFQDYFGALFLADQIASPRWLRSGSGEVGTSKEDLLHYFSDVDWRELLILLFEILASRSDWSETLLIEVFGEEIALPDLASAIVVAAVVSNPYTGLSRDVSSRAMAAAWSQEMTAWRLENAFVKRDSTTVPEILTAADRETSALIWESFAIAGERLGPKDIKLNDCPIVSSIAQLRLPPSVRYLILDGCPLVDVRDLSPFRDLLYISLARTGVFNVEPLGGLENLWGVDLRDTPVANVRPLSSLPFLTFLQVSRTLIEPEQLFEFTSLEMISAEGLPIRDLSFIERSPQLEFLDVTSSTVEDLGPLRKLAQLEQLYVSSTRLVTIEPVCELVNLTSLYFSNTGVASLDPIRNLRKLESLAFSGTAVTDIGLLRHLPALRNVWFGGTSVFNIEPLFALAQLESVDLPTHIRASDRERLRAHFPNIVID